MRVPRGAGVNKVFGLSSGLDFPTAYKPIFGQNNLNISCFSGLDMLYKYRSCKGNFENFTKIILIEFFDI